MLKTFLRNWIFLSVIILANLIIGLRTSIGFFYYFCLLLTLTLVLNFTFVLVEYFTVALKIERYAANKITEDDILKIRTTIENKGLLPAFNIVLEDNLPCAASLQKTMMVQDYLGAGSFVALDYRCVCPRRGRYDLGPFSIYFFDPLGLIYLKKTYKKFSELYVMPRTFNIRHFPPLAKGILPWFGIETSRVSGDEDEFYGVREYKPADPVKRIHWLSSARKGELIVRQFQHQRFFRATLVFNLEEDYDVGQGKEKVSEYMIRIAASVSKYLLERGISLEVIAHTQEFVHLPFNKGAVHLQEIFQVLTLAKAQSRVSLGEVFEEASRFIENDTTVIVIMLDKDWKNLSAILSLDKRNISLIPLILISSAFLYETDQSQVEKDLAIKLSQTLNISPVILSRQDNLAEAFLKYA